MMIKVNKKISLWSCPPIEKMLFQNLCSQLKLLVSTGTDSCKYRTQLISLAIDKENTTYVW